MFENVFQSTFFWLFVGFYVLHEFIHLGLEAINYFYVKKHKTFPEFYRDSITPAIYEKSRTYTLEKIRFSIVAHLAQIPFFWFLVFLDGFNTFDNLAGYYAGIGTLGHSVLFCIFLGMYFGIIGLPFRIYSIFVIEEKYGFNKMTFGLFAGDMIKSLLVGAVIGVPMLFLVFWVMKMSGTYWWLWVWAAITAFQVLMAAVYPAVLAPIFNKFEPLKEGELKDKIIALAKKIKFKMSGTFVIDGSRRSKHSNAYFAGMGKFRRIVLFDTLVNQLTTSELLSVLAHEMGHNVKKHIRNFMILSSALTLAGFFILSLLVKWPDFYSAFNIATPSVHAALVIFMIASEVFTFALTPIMNFFSRRNEYEADRFSVEITGDKDSMKSSLLKLTKENLSNLTPHPAYSFFHYSHPTTIERAQAIDGIQIKS